MKKFGVLLLFSSIMVTFPLTTCAAYLDPGTGSYIIQVIVGTILVGGAGIVYSWNNFRTKLAGLFGRKNKDVEEKKEAGENK